MKYSKATPNNGRLQSVEIYEGETIEEKVARIALCIRILGNAYYLDLHKEKKFSQERDNGELG